MILILNFLNLEFGQRNCRPHKRNTLGLRKILTVTSPKKKRESKKTSVLNYVPTSILNCSLTSKCKNNFFRIGLGKPYQASETSGGLRSARTRPTKYNAYLPRTRQCVNSLAFQSRPLSHELLANCVQVLKL